MPTNVIMPALGVAQQTGTLLKWLKAEGELVSKGEPLMEIETDKATVEIEAPASGVLAQVIAHPGDEVPVGNRIALIVAPGETISEATLSSPRASPLPKGEGKASGDDIARANRLVTSSGPNTTKLATGRILGSPAAKRIARERGVDLASLKGSGPGGSVLAEDVLRASAAETAAAVVRLPEEQIVPLSAMRRIVGERMIQSKLSAPHFYLSMDIDMSGVEKLRAEWKGRGETATVSINDFILRACARALKEFPLLNSTYTEDGVNIHPEINIGMAVALAEGLVVPVIRNADRLTLAELATQSRALIDKAQNKKLVPRDYEDGTFTVSNLGMLGVDSFAAIINPPQCAILAVGRVAPRVVVENEMFAIQSVMTATLSADHRIIDGAIGARFLHQVKTRLEDAVL
jgi:pyruvate dehydrogenase E2 component (dihydrolipoyllysine-residue acetyltransferase)